MAITGGGDTIEKTMTAIESLRQRNQRRSSAAGSGEVSLDAFAEVFAGIAASKIEASATTTLPSEEASVADTAAPVVEPSRAYSTRENQDRSIDRTRRNDASGDDAGQPVETEVDEAEAVVFDGPANDLGGVDEVNNVAVVSEEPSVEPEVAVATVKAEDSTAETGDHASASSRRRPKSATQAHEHRATPDSPIEEPLGDSATIPSGDPLSPQTNPETALEDGSTVVAGPQRQRRKATDAREVTTDADVAVDDGDPVQRRAIPSANGERSAVAALSPSTSSAGPATPVAPPSTVHAAVVAAASAGGAQANSGATAGRSGPLAGSPTRVQAADLTGQKKPGHDAAIAAKPTRGTDTTKTISRVKLVQRVAKAFAHLRRESGQVRMRLAPEGLGSVTVDMRVHKGHVDASVIADSEAAGAALREHLPELRAKLESSGLEVDRLDVRTKDDDQPSSQHRRHHQRPPRETNQPTGKESTKTDAADVNLVA